MKHNEQIFAAMSDIDTDLVAAATVPVRKRAKISRKKWLTGPIAAAMAVMLTLGAAAAGTAVIMKLLNGPIITENNTQLTEVPEGYVGIYTKEDLLKLAKDVENGSCAEKYILMADITFTDADYAPGGICEGGWEPIQLQYRRYYMREHTVKEDGTTVVGGAEIPCTVADITAEYSEMGEYSYGYSVHMCELELFNGNGHVIRGLKIDKTLVTDQLDDPYFIGLFGNAGQTAEGAQIINLGIEGLDITLRGTPDTLTEQINIGGIAGAANYIGACYVKDMTLTVELDEVKQPLWYDGEPHPWSNGVYLLAGGIAGQSDFVDACYVEDYSMNITADGYENVYLSGGGIAARTQAAVTCWAQGAWNVGGDAYASTSCGDLIPDSNRLHLPPLIPGESFEQMMAKMEEHYGEDAFETKKVRAYFRSVSPTAVAYPDAGEDPQTWPDEVREYNEAYERRAALFNKMYALTAEGEVEPYDTFWFYDPWVSEIEDVELRKLLVEAYGSEEAFDAFCAEHTMKTGAVHCATLGGESETDYPHFDFGRLWVLKDGTPRLRVFE